MLTKTMHIENISEMTIQLSSGDAWYVEVTEDDEPEITGCLLFSSRSWSKRSDSWSMKVDVTAPCGR